MTDSREESPDWLRDYQVPSHSLLSLSSDSESSPRKHQVKDQSTDFQGNSTNLDEDEDGERVLSKTTSTLVSNKLSARKSTKRGHKVGDQGPAKRRKTVVCKKRADDRGHKVEEESSDEQMDSHAQDHLVWTLSSDSESDPDTAVKVEDPSAHKSAKFEGDENDEADSINNTREDAPKYSGKGKSLKKRIKEADNVPIVKKNDPDSINSKSKETPKVAKTRKSPRKQLMQADHVPIVAKNLMSHEKKGEKMVEEHAQGKGNGICEGEDIDAAAEVKSEKRVEFHVSTALPLVLPEKVNRSKALIECEGESIDLSGDMGVVGRVIISETPSRDCEMLLDLKGTIYKTTIVPSRTFCVVSVGQSEAKIEAIMNDFIQLKPQSNVYDAETMVEGTLDGFSFDSEDEADKVPKTTSRQSDQNEGAEEQTNQKTKRTAEKKSGAAQKRGKSVGAKQPKKRESQSRKKGKAKKVA
ncbi:hypothetical protein Dimus_028116 [Dionaea muscipula]